MKADVVILVYNNSEEGEGLSSEMDEGEIVPSELFSSLGLLIVESRVPYLSPKGHVDGPHIPSTTGFSNPASKHHVCANNSFLCGRMEAVRRQMQVLWKNHIPMCIEVLLYPDCEHGSQLANTQDVTLPSGRTDTPILLEQWTVQVLPRRGGESVARARELFQAMKSYLHFSQLSAWLNLTHGKAPRNVGYRVSPPAEFCTSSFQEHPEWHTFPICAMTKSSVMKVTVGALPRHTNIIQVPCLEPHPFGTQFVRNTMPASSGSATTVVTTKTASSASAPECRSQQALLQPQHPQDDGSSPPYGYNRNRLSPGHGGVQQQKYNRKSPSRDSGHRVSSAGSCEQNQSNVGREKQRTPDGSSVGSQQQLQQHQSQFGNIHKVQQLQQHNTQEVERLQSQISGGESRGRGRESPGGTGVGVPPTHLDFSKVRHMPEQFCDYRQFLVLPQHQQPQANRDPTINPTSNCCTVTQPDQSHQIPPFPYRQPPMCQPPPGGPGLATHPPPPHHPLQAYLDPTSLINMHQKRSSPVVPTRMEHHPQQSPYPHHYQVPTSQPPPHLPLPLPHPLPAQHQHQQQQQAYNAFLYNNQHSSHPYHSRLYPQTPEDMPSYNNPMQYLGAIPKRASSFFNHKSPPDTHPMRDFFPYHHNNHHHHSTPSPGDPAYYTQYPDSNTKHRSLKAESPKVLFSKKSPTQTFYAQEDLSRVASIGSHESEGSDGSSPEIDKFLKNMSTGTVQPLSPEEIQNYLSRLNIHKNRQSRDKDISSHVCRSLTEKDFMEAEKYPQTTGDQRQQLPAKFVKVLEEANKDLHISDRLPQPSSALTTQEKKKTHEEIDDLDERSTTPTPQSVGQIINEDLISSSPAEHQHHHHQKQKQQQRDEQSTPPAVSSNNQVTSSPTLLDSKATVIHQNKHKKSDSSPTRRVESPKPRSVSPARAARNNFVLPTNREQAEKMVASHFVPKPKRPMSPLTKQLKDAELERSQSPLAKTSSSNGTVESVSNLAANNKSATDKEIFTPSSSPDVVSTSNGHTPHADYNETTSSSDNNKNQKVKDLVPLKIFKGKNRNNNAKGKLDIDDEEIPSSSSISQEKKPRIEKEVVEKPLPKASFMIGDDYEEDEQPKGGAGYKKATPLLHSLLRRDLSEQIKSTDVAKGSGVMNRAIPTPQERASFRRSLDNSTNMIFHAGTGLPLQSSPAPIKKRTSGCFDYDNSLTNIRAIKNSLSCANLEEQDASQSEESEKTQTRFYSASAPASTNCLLGNFEESLLNGRIEPSGVVEGFTAELGASGAFCPKHVVLPVTAFFFNLSDDNAPSPYLGHINLESVGRRGYHVPKKGTVQVTLFNPNKTVVKMFVVMYNLNHMPANCQTFLRQRTLYMPVSGSSSDTMGQPVFLRYLIHLRFSSSKSGKIYLHTDIRLIFARDKFEYDSSVASYELRSFTEGPVNPKFSPKR